jgi:hypothetical protein
LTEICAEDICYKSSNREGLNANTVQEALDELAQRRDSACTFLVSPRREWEKIFDQIPEGQDAQVCFQVGDYPLDAPVDISDKGHIKVTGCGPGTRILSRTSRLLLFFPNARALLFVMYMLRLV